MSKLASALGNKYQENRVSVMTRSFELGNHTFKVRVPSVGEIERIYDYFKSPNADDIEAIYESLTKDLIALKDSADSSVEFKDNDVIVNGRSMKEAATNKAILQYRIVEYIKLLVPENGEMPEDLSYKDVEDEFPLAIQISLVEKINEAISPDYKEIRGK